LHKAANLLISDNRCRINTVFALDRLDKFHEQKILSSTVMMTDCSQSYRLFSAVFLSDNVLSPEWIVIGAVTAEFCRVTRITVRRRLVL
jgi:hypothetical protein